MNRLILITALVFVIIAGLAAGWHLRYSIAPQQPPHIQYISDRMEIRPPGVIGRSDAPITIRAFLSFSSKDSARFFLETLPILRRAIVDRGQASIIFHDTPQDRSALHASVLARCVAASDYSRVAEAIFRNQDAWTSAEDPAVELAQTVMEAGISEKRLASCLSGAGGVELVSKLRDEAFEVHRIKTIPSFLISSGNAIFLLEGTPSAKEFEDAAKRLGNAPGGGSPPIRTP